MAGKGTQTMKVLQPKEVLWLFERRVLESQAKVARLKTQLRDALMHARVNVSILNDYKREIAKRQP